MKLLQVLVFILAANTSNAQRIDSIYVNLYTDSLKRGTFNYINIDGKTDKGNYLPLDTTFLCFKSSIGHFYGNSLWLEADCTADKVSIVVYATSNPSLRKEFDVYIKKSEENEELPSEEEIMKQLKKKKD